MATKGAGLDAGTEAQAAVRTLVGALASAEAHGGHTVVDAAVIKFFSRVAGKPEHLTKETLLSVSRPRHP
jgi:hypothetical protein